MAALSTIHDVTGRRLVNSIYSWDIYAVDRWWLLNRCSFGCWALFGVDYLLLCAQCVFVRCRMALNPKVLKPQRLEPASFVSKCDSSNADCMRKDARRPCGMTPRQFLFEWPIEMASLRLRIPSPRGYFEIVNAGALCLPVLVFHFRSCKIYWLLPDPVLKCRQSFSLILLCFFHSGLSCIERGSGCHYWS
jgi:hypothetical protein